MHGDAAYPECFLSEEAGFLPVDPPRASLPAGYEAWDQLATELPHQVATLSVRSAVAQFPGFDVEGLPATALSRAASLLGICVHALVREQQILRAPVSIPAPLQQAWDDVCRRLARPTAGLTYNDLLLYNWRLRDPRGPRCVENMDLLTPVFGSEEERLFYLVMVETHAVATPLVGALPRIERAVRNEDTAQLSEELARLRAVLDAMTFTTFLKVDPNPYSRYFVDHLVWSKTVAPFAYPVRPGELGLSGGGSPVFHVLDALFGRAQWNSSIGQELVALRRWMNPPLVAFIERAAALDLPGYVLARPALHTTFDQMREAYVGERGWLGVHRLKVYGFMEVAFKAGRTQTNGGFSGDLAERAWESLDDELETARVERGPRGRCPMARQASVRPAAQAPVFQVVLDTALQARPGDRLGLWPRNTPELVERTLHALQASGQEPLKLTLDWRTRLAWLSATPAGSTVVPLRTFLEFAKLRPLARSVGKQLLQLAFVPELNELLNQRREDEYEVWEVLELMRHHNYDTRRLWRASPWHRESLARILPAEQKRIYSVSSGPAEPATLTVGQLALTTPQLGVGTHVSRLGTGSHHVTRSHAAPFAAEVVRPSRFALPNGSVPVVMFAAGSGISPFRGFWRARRGAPALTWLLATVRDRGSLAYAQELTDEVATHGLEVHVTCSRSDEELVSSGSRLVARPAVRGYVDRAILEHKTRLWNLLRPASEGGEGGCFYVCGQTRFAHTVLAALRTLASEQLVQAPESPAVLDFVRRLHAEGRVMMDIFTTFAPRDSASVHPYRTYDASDLIERNNDRNGYWCAISGLVYDVTEFQWLHPGGSRLLRLNAGLDATRSYEKVNHHLNAEVHASLDLYKIGKIRRLDLGHRWGVTVLPLPSGTRPDTATARADGLLYFTLGDLYRHWIRYVFQVVEVENSLMSNLDLGHSPRLLSAPPGSRMHLAFQVDLLRLFGETALAQIAGPALIRLWHLQVGLCSAEVPLPQLARELASGPGAVRPRVQEVLRRCFDMLAGDDALPAGCLQELLAWTCHWLADAKAHLRGAIVLFERHEKRVVEEAGAELTGILAAMPARLAAYAAGLETIVSRVPTGPGDVQPRGGDRTS